MYDVVVIGLGPAGSTAARQLASRGHQVLALEKAASLPRAKPCGGCLSARIRRHLDDEVAHTAEAEIRRVVLTFGPEHEIPLETAEPLAYMVSRPVFDQHLAERAAAAGAEIRLGQAVREIHHGPDGCEVVTAADRFRSRFVIGADGVNGVGRRLGEPLARQPAVAYEVEAHVPARVLDARTGTIQLDIRAIAHGYGWVFPKADHLSVGVGTLDRPIRHPRADYEDLVRDFRLPGTPSRAQGYRIPVYAGGAPRICGTGWALAGDAAALADPFLGEGVYYAVISAQAAARAIDAALGRGDTDLPDYQQWARTELYPELAAAGRLAALPYRYPRIAFALLTVAPDEARPLADVLQGRRTYRQCWSHVLGRAARLPAAVRASGRRPRMASARSAQPSAYGAADFLWKETVAPGAWRRFVERVSDHVFPGAAVLDAFTRTGAAARRVRDDTRAGPVVACDPSEAMLRAARGRQRHGVDLVRCAHDRLPFADGRFDVVCAWLLEPGPAPRRVVAECLRVLKEDGTVVCAFPTRPGGRDRLYAWLLEFFRPGLPWRFLDEEEQPRHACDRFESYSFRKGTMTVAVLRKCCTMEPTRSRCGAEAAAPRVTMQGGPGGPQGGAS